jgi:toxin YoeB
MRKIQFEPNAFNEYNEWASLNKKVFQKIAKLIINIQKDPFSGLGNPEPLKHNLKGLWSRQITDEHRLVYKITDNEIIIMSCKFHYPKL